MSSVLPSIGLTYVLLDFLILSKITPSTRTFLSPFPFPWLGPDLPSYSISSPYYEVPTNTSQEPPVSQRSLMLPSLRFFGRPWISRKEEDPGPRSHPRDRLVVPFPFTTLGSRVRVVSPWRRGPPKTPRSPSSPCPSWGPSPSFYRIRSGPPPSSTSFDSRMTEASQFHTRVRTTPICPSGESVVHFLSPIVWTGSLRERVPWVGGYDRCRLSSRLGSVLVSVVSRFKTPVDRRTHLWW